MSTNERGVETSEVSENFESLGNFNPTSIRGHVRSFMGIFFRWQKWY